MIDDILSLLDLDGLQQEASLVKLGESSSTGFDGCLENVLEFPPRKRISAKLRKFDVNWGSSSHWRGSTHCGERESLCRWSGKRGFLHLECEESDGFPDILLE